jgi:hypothetical protein
MRRKTKTTEVRRYSCPKCPVSKHNPVENETKLITCIYQGNDYRNTLVEIENKRREVYNEILVDCEQEYKNFIEAKTTLDELVKLLKEKRASVRKRVKDTDLSNKIKIARERKNFLYKELKEAKKKSKNNPLYKTKLENLKDEFNNKTREARTWFTKGGGYHGTYLPVEQGMKAAKSGPPPKKRKTPHDTNKNTGCVYIQWQHTPSFLKKSAQYGGDVNLLLSGQDNSMRLDVPDYHSIGSTIKKARGRFYIRIGTEKEQPVFASVPVVIHRQFPKDCNINAAYLYRYRIGRRFHYSVQWIVEANNLKKPNYGSGYCGIDIGMRQTDDGLRVAFWASDYEDGSLTLPTRLIEAFKKVRDLQQIRDRHFNEFRVYLVEWLKAHDFYPDWFYFDTKTLNSWRSPQRLAEFIFKWKKNRFDGDDEIFDKSDSWRTKENHLYDYERNLHHQAMGQRTQLYRDFASKLNKKFAIVGVEDLDLTKWQKLDKSEDNISLPKNVRSNRTIAALSNLIKCINESGMLVYKIDPNNTSRECNFCGYINESTELQFVTCAECGQSIDRDLRAATNIRQRTISVHTSGKVAQKTPSLLATLTT